MQKTVREIIEMIDNNQLHYNQSTQRKFIYAEMKDKVSTLDEDGRTLSTGETSKSGSLINAILEDHIVLPAVYFWKNSETDELHIHDGKQRILSLYYFIKGDPTFNITTIRKNRPIIFECLDEEDKDALLNYSFDIVERSGTSLEEERSFFLINTHGLALTPYECLSGMFHGTFLNEFEAYIESVQRDHDHIDPVNRGVQAYNILCMMFGLPIDTKEETRLRLNECLRPIRHGSFAPANYLLTEKLNLFNTIMNFQLKIGESVAMELARYLIENHYDTDEMIRYYRDCRTRINDISSWDMDRHKVFIDAFINRRLQLDPLRIFSKETKDSLYLRCNCCAHINEDGTRCTENKYNKLEVDHITPWINGGRTIMDNAQLLCKSHNSSKKDRLD